MKDLADAGQPIKAWLERPEIDQRLVPVWAAFHALSGDRAAGFEGLGPIPFLAIDRYCERFGLADDVDQFECVHALIRAMDAEYRKPKPTEAAPSDGR